MNDMVTNKISYIEGDLESMLDALSKHGLPTLRRMSDGSWYAYITMNVSSNGVEFKVDSGFKHKTHRAALKCCRDRMIQALKDLDK